ncbi:hypothetical protein DFH09DRAFT_1317716 [Mycena vulgaris]|nr:hypothetical protein DFH09DRAFT_1317716 [Mycena vulgaris]
MSTASATSSNVGKENDTAEQLHNLKRRGDNYHREVYNGRKKLKRSHAATTDQSSSLAEGREENGQLRGEVGQLMAEAKAKAREELSELFSFTLKEKGVVPDSTRDLINDLIAFDGLGIEATGNAADRTVRRIVKEGVVASHMQFVDAVCGFESAGSTGWFIDTWMA